MFIPFSYVSFFTRSLDQEKSLSYYDLFDFRVLLYGRILTLIFYFLIYHPTYTHHQGPHNMGRSGEEYVMASMYGEEEDPGSMVEDYVQPKLGPAKVGLVLPSNPSEWQVGLYYQKPLLDQARFGHQ